MSNLIFNNLLTPAYQDPQLVAQSKLYPRLPPTWNLLFWSTL